MREEEVDIDVDQLAMASTPKDVTWITDSDATQEMSQIRAETVVSRTEMGGTMVLLVAETTITLEEVEVEAGATTVDITIKEEEGMTATIATVVPLVAEMPMEATPTEVTITARKVMIDPVRLKHRDRRKVAMEDTEAMALQHQAMAPLLLFQLTVGTEVLVTLHLLQPVLILLLDLTEDMAMARLHLMVLRPHTDLLLPTVHHLHSRTARMARTEAIRLLRPQPHHTAAVQDRVTTPRPLKDIKDMLRRMVEDTLPALPHLSHINHLCRIEAIQTYPTCSNTSKISIIDTDKK